MVRLKRVHFSLIFLVLFIILFDDGYLIPQRIIASKMHLTKISNNMVVSSVDEDLTHSLPPNFLESRTHSCLDFDVLLEYMRNYTITKLGREMCLSSFYSSSDVIRLEYQKIQQLLSHALVFLPLRSSFDTSNVFYKITYNVSPMPDKEELSLFCGYMDEIIEIREYLMGIGDNKVDALTSLIQGTSIYCRTHNGCL